MGLAIWLLSLGLLWEEGDRFWNFGLEKLFECSELLWELGRLRLFREMQMVEANEVSGECLRVPEILLGTFVCYFRLRACGF